MQLPLDHVAIAVPSIARALPIYELLTGSRGSPVESVSGDDVRVAFVGSGASRIELVEPAAPDSSVARFLERRGPGLHHIALRVPDLAARLDELANAGVRLIDRTPRVGAHGRRVAFIHPKSADGVLVELVEG